MRIRILCVGKLKEPYWREAEAEYLKRLSAYAQVAIEELPDASIPKNASEKEEAQIKEKEGSELLSRLKPNDFVCLLDLNKEEPDSYALAEKVQAMLQRGGASLTFVIGGSLGLGENIRKRANASLSLSKLTFTHQMTRLILLEQVYRSFKILRGEPYSK
jgi:23S rRNA (pseudouridine1915-N3)-methyltransferase